MEMSLLALAITLLKKLSLYLKFIQNLDKLKLTFENEKLYVIIVAK